MEIVQFETEFVRRTKCLVKDYQGPNDMSILINCTLGLIILPHAIIDERLTPNPPFWDTELGKIPNLPSFELRIFEPIQGYERSKGIKKSKFKYYPKTLRVLLRKIRDGLAHPASIQPVNQDGNFAGVIIRNYFNKKELDLEVHFSKPELTDFALFIADEYLK